MGIVSISANFEPKRSHRCQRCGGQVLGSYEETTCLQCGAAHTREGSLVIPTCLDEKDISGKSTNRSAPRNVMKLRLSKS